jgi:enoyl-[acyl-carrier-protein] reductase (NADH)
MLLKAFRWAASAGAGYFRCHLFLLSDLSAFITGSTVTVDGGIAMRG